MILVWSLIILACFIVFLASMYIVLRKKYKKLNLDVARIAIAIKRVRYGDFNVRLDKLNNKNLQSTINSLIESMYDREMMIKEYQSTLSNKNLSLEEILKQEKQLQMFKEEFAATLAHDMKVPVIAELNSLNYLLEGRFGELNPNQKEILNLMKSSNQELKDLIENMLETYRLEQKKLELSLTENNFNEFLDLVIKEMEPIAISTKHSIIADLKETNHVILSFDTFQIKRVVKNLLQNALSFSQNATEITIETQKYQNEVKVMVTNKGAGISPEDLDMIFHKYYSGQSKFRKAGTGLGLYLSQQIMLAHNGTIEVDCSKAGFTTFILTIPFNN